MGAFQDMENFKALAYRIYDLSFVMPPILFLGVFQICRVWLTLIVLENQRSYKTDLQPKQIKPGTTDTTRERVVKDYLFC